MHAIDTRPCCKRCWFRQSRPRLARFSCPAQQLNPQNRPSADRQHSVTDGKSTSRFKSDQVGSPSPQEASLTQPAGLDLSLQTAPQRLVAYGDSHAASQADQLLAAINDIRQTEQQAASTPEQGALHQETKAAQPEAGSSTVAQAKGQQANVANQVPQSAAAQPSRSLSKAQMLAKLAQAKAYKQDKNKGTSVPAIQDSSNPASESSPPASEPVAQPTNLAPQPRDSFSATQRSTERSEAPSDGPSDPGGAQQATDGTGSATQPARFLQQAVQHQNEVSKTMSPEAYSLLKEQQKRNQKVEIISVDKSYSKDRKVMDPNYNPKVATWGVFERPANISEAYGGGRTIRAGTPLEDAAATLARKERIAAALSRYKQDAALTIDPVLLQKSEAAFAEGEELFNGKQIAAALTKYAVAAELMPIKTALGGRARLQQAICLDSLGQNKEAYAIYSLIQTHPTVDVAKQAKRMIFGFKAMDNLKAHTMSYSVTKGAYDEYFNRFTGDWNAAYVSSNDNSTEVSKAVIIALLLMLAPLALILGKILF